METIIPQRNWQKVSAQVYYKDKMPSWVNLDMLNDEIAAKVRKQGNLDYFDQKAQVLYTSNADKYANMRQIKRATIGIEEVSTALQVKLGFDPGNLLPFEGWEFITNTCLVFQKPGYRVVRKAEDYFLKDTRGQEFPLMLVAGIRPEEENLRGIDPDYFRDRVQILAQEPGLGLRTAFVFPTNDLLIQGRPGLVTSVLQQIKPRVN